MGRGPVAGRPVLRLPRPARPGFDEPQRPRPGPRRAFDLAHRQWVARRTSQPTPRLDTPAAGPSSRTTQRPLPVVGRPHVGRPGQASPLDRNLLRHAALLDVPAAPGRRRPVRLAVGHYWGFSVFELDQGGGAADRGCASATRERSRAGAVRRRQLADFLLQRHDAGGLGPDRRKWPRTSSERNSCEGRRPRSVPGGGHGRPGVGGGVVGRRRGGAVRRWAKTGSTGGPAAWLKRLADLQPGVVHSFDVVRDGRNITAGGKQPLYTSVKQRPLWRFFPAGDGEWVLWMWRNNFYDSSTKGDYFVGWHVNAPTRRTRRPSSGSSNTGGSFAGPTSSASCSSRATRPRRWACWATTRCPCTSTTWSRRPRP